MRSRLRANSDHDRRKLPVAPSVRALRCGGRSPTSRPNDCSCLHAPRRASQRSLEACADPRLVAPRSGAAYHVHIPRAGGLSRKMVGRPASRLDVRLRGHSARPADGGHRDRAQRKWRLSRARRRIWSVGSGLGPSHYSRAGGGWHPLHRPGTNRSRSDDAICLGICNGVLSLAASAMALAGETTISILIEASVSHPLSNGRQGRSTLVIRGT